MFKLFALFFFVNQILVGKCDYTSYDYCSVKCEQSHSACKCGIKSDGRKYIEDDMANFRGQMVDLHNKYREIVASGKATQSSGDTPGNAKITSASNMRVIQYDMELEHIMGCYLKNSYVQADHDCACCRLAEDGSHVGQNLFFSTADTATAEEAVKSWYDEIKIFTGDIKSFQSGGWGHWSQIIWAETDRVGCARLHWKHSGFNMNLAFVIGCNYKIAGNFLGQPIYKAGKPCNECPEKLKCHSKKYPSLCGGDPDKPDGATETEAGGTSNGIRNKHAALLVVASIAFNLIRDLLHIV